MFNNPMQMVSQFMQFQQSFRGDPQQEVMKLLQSGQLNQAQLNQLQSMASQFQQMLRSMNR